MVGPGSDTVVDLGELAVNIRLWPLFQKKIMVQQVRLENLRADIGKVLSSLPEEEDPNREKIQEPEVATAENSWTFGILHLDLIALDIRFRDETTGFDLSTQAGSINIRMGDLNFEEKISVGSVSIANTDVRFELLQTPPDEEPDTSSTPLPDIELGSVLLEEVTFNLIDSVTEMFMFTGAGELRTTGNAVSMKQEQIHVNEVDVINSYCDLRFLALTDTLQEPTEPTDSEQGSSMNWGTSLWRISGRKFNLENFRYSMDYVNEPEIMGHFDPLHMNIREAGGTLSDFLLDADTLIATIRDFQAKESHGLELREFNADLIQEDGQFVIRDLQLRTVNTDIALDLHTTSSPTDLSGLDKDLFKLDLEAVAKNLMDVEYVYPFLKDSELFSPGFGNSNLLIESRLDGSFSNLDLTKFSVQLMDSIRFSLSGNLKNIMEEENRTAELTITELLASRSNLEAVFDTSVLDTGRILPAYVLLTGKYLMNGSENRFAGDVQSGIGSINLTDVYAVLDESPEYRVRMDARLHHLNTLLVPELETCSFSLEANYSGEDFSSGSGDLTLNVDSVLYNAYLYRDILLNGAIEAGHFFADLQTSMRELTANLDIKGIYQNEGLGVDLSLDVANVDLYALNFADTAFTFSSSADLSFGSRPENNLEVSFNLDTLNLDYRDSVYSMHPIKMTFTTREKYTDLHLESFYYGLDFSAEAHIQEFADALQDVPRYYIRQTRQDTSRFVLPEFHVQGNLEYPEVFANLFFPDLPEFDKLVISGGYSATTDSLSLEAKMPHFRSGELYADSLSIEAVGSSETFNYSVATDLQYGDLLKGYGKIFGKFNDQEFISTLNYSDGQKDDYLNLTMHIDTLGDMLRLRFDPDSLVFSYDPWEVDPENTVLFGQEKIKINRLNLNHQDERISIATVDETNTIKLNLEKFELGSLERLFNNDTLVRGKATAEVKISEPTGTPSLRGYLLIDDLSVMGYHAGRFSLNSFFMGADSASLNLDLKGEAQAIDLVGSWNGSDTISPIAAELNIERLELENLEPFIAEYIYDPKGRLTGRIKVNGTLDVPLINGEISFRETGIGLDILNSYYNLGDEQISVKDNVFQFQNLTISNQQKQSARINGNINLGDVSKAYTDLTIKTDNMELMNSKQKENDVLFGLLKAQAEIEAKGEAKNIRVTSEITIDKSTDVTYIFPDELTMDNNEGVVVYQKFEPKTEDDEDIEKSFSFFSLQSLSNLNSTVEIQEGARFNLYFDRKGDNYLDAALNGTVNYNMLEDNMEVSGMFIIDEGTLHYSIPMVTVETYAIEPGSTISLTNDLYNPYLNLIASSKIRASTEGLMGGDPKVMMFTVLLYMEGELNDVKVWFDIDQETDDAIVSSRLAQLSEQERNINALNLLVRGSFVVSLQGDEVGGTTSMDAQIDKFYTAQLNQIVGDNIGFVDLKFDVQSFKEYNTDGEAVVQRNYYYNVGKSFFNDRARINYKGSLGLTNDMEAERINSSFVQDELEVEVKITKDGVFRGIFFRKNQYEGLLEGEVIDTGLGIRLKKDFYSIRDVFVDLDKRDEKKGEEKINDK